MLLAIDTSSVNCAVALKTGDELTCAKTERIGRGHAEVLLPMIEDALRASAVEYKELTAVGVTVGPGSFTGIRVGVAAARGLGVALNIPIIGVPSLMAIAKCIESELPRLIAINARREEAFCQLFCGTGHAEEVSDPFLLKPDDRLEDLGLPGTIAVAGDAAVSVTKRLQGCVSAPEIHEDMEAPTIEAVADFASSVISSGRTSDYPPKPIYLREADAKPQAKGIVARA